MRLKLALLGAATLFLVSAASARAAPACTAEALRLLPVLDLKVTEATPVAAAGGQPAHCLVQGTVTTRGEGTADGLARFSIRLPEAWSRRFLFLGVGGNAGTLQPSANAVDRSLALGKGYAVILTDTGHQGDGNSSNWVRRPDGSLDQPKVTDFLYRAAHSVTVAGKALTQAYYGAAIERAYFDGCSTGGRMALAAAIHYPGDYSGIIAGDPAMDYNIHIARMATQRIALAAPARYIPPETVAALDRRAVALCDALDGAKDGLVQNPAACVIRPEDFACRARETGACLSAEQLVLFRAYISPLRDRQGRAVYPGWPVAHLVGPGAASFQTFGFGAPDSADPQKPWGDDDSKAPRSFRQAREALTDWLGYGRDARIQTADLAPSVKTAGPDLMARMRAVTGPGTATDPAALDGYLAAGGKLILYHGASDPTIPAARTVDLYEGLAARQGMERLQSGARLFLVPGMHHCAGGPGPDRFDTLTALERWVEKGEAPALIPAATGEGAATPRSIPLCPYPQQGLYRGAGEMGDGRNWSCAGS